MPQRAPSRSDRDDEDEAIGDVCPRCAVYEKIKLAADPHQGHSQDIQQNDADDNNRHHRHIGFSPAWSIGPSHLAIQHNKAYEIFENEEQPGKITRDCPWRVLTRFPTCSTSPP